MAEWLKKATNAIKAGFNSFKNTCVKYSPEIAFASGVTLMVAGVGLAVYKSIKPDEEVEQLKLDIQKLDEKALTVSDEEGSVYTSEDLKAEKAELAVRGAGVYAWNYIVPFMFLVGSTICYAKGQAWQKSRTLTAVAVGTGIMYKYNQLCDRIRERYGDDALYELVNGIEVTKISDDVEVYTPKKEEQTALDTTDFIRIFDELSSHHTSNPDYNMHWVNMQMEQLETMCYLQGFISFNQMCYIFDVPKNTKKIPGYDKLTEGDVVGVIWRKDVTHNVIVDILDQERLPDKSKRFGEGYNELTGTEDDHMYQGDRSIRLRFHCPDILTDYIAV